MSDQELENSQSSLYNAFEEKINLKKWDEDEVEIRNFLKKLQTDLEQSFIQTRLDRGVKEDEIQLEFELSVKEILNKEHQLKLSLELAYVLLEKIQEQRGVFYDEIDEFQEQKDILQREIDFKEQYCEEYQRRLQQLTDQNSDLQKEYGQLEIFTEKLKSRNSELDQELLKSFKHIEEVRHSSEQDTNSKVILIQNELESLKNHNMQLSKDLSESKKKVQLEMMQQQELLKQIDELKKYNNLLLKEGDAMKKQTQEAIYKVQAIQDEKEKLEIQLMSVQYQNHRSQIRKDSKESDIMENDSNMAQAHINNASMNDAERNHGNQQFSALYGEILGSNKNSQNKMGDDMFNYYSSNRDSHTEDNYKSDSHTRKTKTLTKNKFTKRFNKTNQVNNANTNEANNPSQQTIVENVDEQEYPQNFQRSETYTYFKENNMNKSKNYQDNDSDENDDSDFLQKNRAAKIVQKKYKLSESFNNNTQKNEQNTQPKIKIDDQQYSSVDDSIQAISLQEQKLEEPYNSYDQQVNSYKNQNSLFAKDKQNQFDEDQRIQEEEEQEEEKHCGEQAVAENNNQNKQQIQDSLDNDLNKKSSDKLDTSNEKQKNNIQVVIQEDVNKSSNTNNNSTQHKIGMDEDGIQLSVDNKTKNDKYLLEIQTPTQNQKDLSKKQLSEQKQVNEFSYIDSLSKCESADQPHTRTQANAEKSSFSNQKLNQRNQDRRFSPRKQQNHRKTNFMKEMKTYIQLCNQVDLGENVQNNQYEDTINESQPFNRKLGHQHTRSLLIPSDSIDLQLTYIKNKSNPNQDEQNNTIPAGNQQINKNILNLHDNNQNFSPSKAFSQRENLYKMYRSGIKSASMTTYPINNQKDQFSHQPDNVINELNMEHEDQYLQLENAEQEKQIKSSIYSNLPLQEYEDEEDQDIVINRKDMITQKELQQAHSDKDEGSEFLTKSKGRDEIQTYDMNKLHSINGEEIDRQATPSVKDHHGSKDEVIQLSNIIQSLQNGIKNQQFNPEYESISEMLNTQSKKSKDSSIQRTYFRLGTQNQKEKTSRKDPYEEFFNLTAQTVKLNSSYFDVISSVNVAPIYEEVKKLQIPFHKWQEFLIQKFEKVYNDMKSSNKLQLKYKVDLEQKQQNSGTQLQLCSTIHNTQSIKRTVF